MIMQVSGAVICYKTTYRVWDNNWALFCCSNAIFMHVCECALCRLLFCGRGAGGSTHVHLFSPKYVFFVCMCRAECGQRTGCLEKVPGRGEGDDGWWVGDWTKGWWVGVCRGRLAGWLAGYVYRCEFVRAKVCVCGCVHTSAYLSACV